MGYPEASRFSFLYNLNMKLVIAIIFCELAGVLGSVFTAPAINSWYVSLAKPSFNPPNWVFGPVWTALFLLMGIALFLVWNSKSHGQSLRVFVLQLILNVFWTVIFFGLENPSLALIEIGLLWLSIIWTVMEFQKVSKTAAYLLLPYLFWVSFAAVLNFSIVLLN